MNDYQKKQLSKRAPVKPEVQRPQWLVSQKAGAYSTVRRESIDPAHLTTSDVMTLQRSVGNRAVAQLMSRDGHTEVQRSPQVPVIQTHGGQQLHGVVQRDEIVPMEEYGS